MSITATNWVWSLNDKALPNAGTKLALLKHADHAHDDGTHTWQTIPTIAKFALCSTRTAQRINGWLLENGLIREGDQSVIPDKYKTDKSKPIAYELAMNETTRMQWEIDHAAGSSNPLYRASQAAGAKGGKKTAAIKAAAKVQVGEGDNLAPQGSVSTPGAESDARGDNLAPQARGDNGDTDGVTNETGRGDTGVTQTTQVTTPVNPPSFPAESAQAAETAPSSPAEVASPDGSANEEKDPRATRIPKDFAVTPDMVEWARQQCPDVDGRVETQNFIDFWTAKGGKDARKADWKRTWQVWFRNAQKRLNERRTERGTAYRDKDVWGDERPTILTGEDADRAWGITPPPDGVKQTG